MLRTCSGYVVDRSHAHVVRVCGGGMSRTCSGCVDGEASVHAVGMQLGDAAAGSGCVIGNATSILLAWVCGLRMARK